MLYLVSNAIDHRKDIIDTAIENGSFETLIATVKVAGLVDTLKGQGPFTLFAPTDAAFSKLPEGTVADLLKSENKSKLVAILTHHVLAGAVPSNAVFSKNYLQIQLIILYSLWMKPMEL